MFESKSNEDDAPRNLRRRAFFLTSAPALAGLAVWSLRKPRIAQATAPKVAPQEVMIVLFSDSGERVKTVHIPKVVKTEEEWRKQLTPERLTSLVTPIRKSRSQENTGNSRTRASSAASVATMLYSALTQKLTLEPAGQASGRRLRRKILEPRGTRATALSATPYPAPNATRI